MLKALSANCLIDTISQKNRLLPLCVRLFTKGIIPRSCLKNKNLFLCLRVKTATVFVEVLPLFFCASKKGMHQCLFFEETNDIAPYIFHLQLFVCPYIIYDEALRRYLYGIYINERRF